MLFILEYLLLRNYDEYKSFKRLCLLLRLASARLAFEKDPHCWNLAKSAFGALESKKPSAWNMSWERIYTRKKKAVSIWSTNPHHSRGEVSCTR